MKRGFIVLALTLLASLPAWAQAPRRVVTVNLCLDQLALRLAAPGQLVGVSYLAFDPQVSVLAEQARSLVPVRARVESILDLRPDLVIFDAGAHLGIKDLVRRAGVPILEVPWAASLEEAEALIERLAVALGRREVGRALIDRMRAERSTLVWRGPPTALAAVLQANGGTTGKGSLMDELLRLTGYRNLAAELGVPAYGRWSFETVLARQPDVLVLDAEANANPARGTEFVDHAAFKSSTGKMRRVAVPMKYSICAGPDNLQAMRLLAEARR
jgi:iron complex transport system substrate-binding protein